VKKLNTEIDDAIHSILHGGTDESSEPPRLEISLDDEQL
jgi:hypothetical protein